VVLLRNAKKKKKINTKDTEGAQPRRGKDGHPQKDDHTLGRAELGLRHAALESEEDEVGAAADAEFAEKVGDVKFYGAFGDIEFAGDFFVGQIFEEGVQDFLLAAAEIGDGISFEAAALVGQDGIDEAGKNGARNPEATVGNQRKSAGQLLAGFRVS
jgi:hypothetical protein